jgi:tRNA(fMet)-specific endonuclease VapC
MKYLLDTDTCIYWLKGNWAIEERIQEIGFNDLVISFISLGELYYGAYKSHRLHENLQSIRRLTKRLGVVDSTNDICRLFGQFKAA